MSFKLSTLVDDVWGGSIIDHCLSIRWIFVTIQQLQRAKSLVSQHRKQRPKSTKLIATLRLKIERAGNAEMLYLRLILYEQRQWKAANGEDYRRRGGSSGYHQLTPIFTLKMEKPRDFTNPTSSVGIVNSNSNSEENMVKRILAQFKI